MNLGVVLSIIVDERHGPPNGRFRQIGVVAMQDTQDTRPRTTRQTKGYVAAAVIAAGLFCWYANAEAAWASQATSPATGSTGLVTHLQQIEGRPTRVIVIDPALRVMAVYEIGREKAEIKLLSSRNFSYDMQMLGYNSVDPSPEDIKKILDMQ